MRRVMRRVRMRRVRTVTGRPAECGATAIMIALLLVPLLGFGALVIDVGALVQERRELQNGADAGALAVAKDCAAGSCGAFDATADSFADANALDGDSNVGPGQVCGSGPGLPACAADPPEAAGVPNWVKVTTDTQEVSSGSNQITFRLAQLLGLTGASVNRRSVAAWGAPSSATVIPLTFSMCEFDAATAGGTVYASGPPFSGPPRIVYFHGSVQAGTCPAGPSGGDDPISGGFGWLANSSSCEVTISAGGWVDDKPGNGVPNGCDPADWRDKVVLLPVYDGTNGLTGSNGQYHVAGFAAVHIVGYRFSGTTWPSGTVCPAQPGSSGRCILGHFVRFVTTADALGGPDLGVAAVKTIG